MLTAEHRLTSADDFRRAVRRGKRAGGSLLAAHVLCEYVDKETYPQMRVGFVVSKAVGRAVVRNQVKRRLRHLMRERLELVPGGSLVVIRALPGAADASFGELGAELDRCLERARVSSAKVG